MGKKIECNPEIFTGHNGVTALARRSHEATEL
jgi:hypothetical protein